MGPTNGEPTAKQRPEKQTNAQTEERANEQQEWANGLPHDRVNDQTVHQSFTGENERTRNRVNELAKQGEKLNACEWTALQFKFKWIDVRIFFM